MYGTNKIPNSDIIGYEGKVGFEKAIHKTHWHSLGVNLKRTRDNGFVWVWLGGKQIRMKRVDAEEEGYEIIPQKRDKRRKGAEVRNGISSHKPSPEYS